MSIIAIIYGGSHYLVCADSLGIEGGHAQIVYEFLKECIPSFPLSNLYFLHLNVRQTVLTAVGFL